MLYNVPLFWSEVHSRLLFFISKNPNSKPVFVQFEYEFIDLPNGSHYTVFPN